MAGGIHDKGGMCGRGCVARGAYTVEGKCMAEGHCGRGACVAGVMHGRGCVCGRDYAWQGGLHGMGHA